MDDSRIVDLFFERSEQAIKELSAKYGKLAQVVCANILKNESDAEECVNDSLLNTWNAIPPAKPVSSASFPITFRFFCIYSGSHLRNVAFSSAFTVHGFAVASPHAKSSDIPHME